MVVGVNIYRIGINFHIDSTNLSRNLHFEEVPQFFIGGEKIKNVGEMVRLCIIFKDTIKVILFSQENLNVA